MRLIPPVLLLAACAAPAPQEDPPAAVRRQADGWRAQRRLIDLHQHVAYTDADLARAVRIMDQVGIGVGVNLSGGTVTRRGDQPSEFERNKALADRRFPDRFVHYMNLDYGGWDEPDFAERAARQIDEGRRLGAAGLKEYKRLGLTLRDRAGRLIKVDDPKLDGVWRRCGELGLPVSIHVADPRAFWLPFDETNERWKELKDHKSWWFGDPAKHPPREELLAALNRVIERHPKTTFVCVHFANNAEDLEWVERSLDRYPNMMADLAARVPEIGRHDPAKVRRLFVKHADRILFATDFMVDGNLTLGSGGSGPPPTDADAVEFFAKHGRWLETRDRDFAHMTPIQGDWTISAIGLPADALRKIYFDNAQRLLARALPPPRLRATRLEVDFAPTGDLSQPDWSRATPVWLEYQSADVTARPQISTRVRALWSDRFLYLGYEAPYTTLTTFEPPQREERLGLWDRDVLEAFIGSDPERPNHYTEFEVAPTGEKLDLILKLPEKDFAWSSGFDAPVRVDPARRVWSTVMRIPLAALGDRPPRPGTRWRINLYRCDRAHGAFLAWRPTLAPSFHVPERFGTLEFE
jgi:predicted TIM-barrel fold metal-dependent hydrolase